MKKILIIAYNNLSGSDSKIPLILDAQPNFRKIFESTWLVATSETANAFFKTIEPYLDKDNDRIIVCVITKGYQGWLSAPIWEWVKANQD